MPDPIRCLGGSLPQRCQAFRSGWMPSWVPAQIVIGYVTGAAARRPSVVFRKQPRRVVSLVGVWLLVLVAVIYVPFLISSLADAKTGVQLVGINYFADTLLFVGAVLSLAAASPRDADTMHISAVQEVDTPRRSP